MQAKGVCGAVGVNHEKITRRSPEEGREQAGLGRKLMVRVEIREKEEGGRQERGREIG